MEEIWKDISGYEGLYQVSNTGKVKSLSRTWIKSNGRRHTIHERIINGQRSDKGYIQVRLQKKGANGVFAVHRIVANAFLENKENKEQVNHIDGNKGNNAVSNLEWVTASENVRHAFRTGLNKPLCGEEQKGAKLTEEMARFIKANYKPRDMEYSQYALARRFGVSRSAIQQVLRGNNWKRAV